MVASSSSPSREGMRSKNKTVERCCQKDYGPGTGYSTSMPGRHAVSQEASPTARPGLQFRDSSALGTVSAAEGAAVDRRGARDPRSWCSASLGINNKRDFVLNYPFPVFFNGFLTNFYIFN